MDLTSNLEAKFGARSGQVHQIRRKIWEVLLPQDTKVGKGPNFGVISEIQRAKFGVFVIYIFGGKIWGSKKNFRGKIWGQAPYLLICKYPPGLTSSMTLTYNLQHTVIDLISKLSQSDKCQIMHVCKIYFET